MLEGGGVEKAPPIADCFCSCSNISCSSFGRRGGAGPGDHDEWALRVVVKVRWVGLLERWRRALRARGSRVSDAIACSVVDFGCGGRVGDVVWWIVEGE